MSSPSSNVQAVAPGKDQRRLREQSPQDPRTHGPSLGSQDWAEEGQRRLTRPLTASPLRLLGEEQEFLTEADASNYINFRKKKITRYWHNSENITLT